MGAADALTSFFAQEEQGGAEAEPSREATQSSENEPQTTQAETENASAEGEGVEASSEAQNVEQQPETETAQEGVEGEEFNLTSLSELAEATELDLDTIMSLKVTTKVDGEVGEDTLANIVKNYQLEGNLTKEHQKLADQRKAFEDETKAKSEALEQGLNTANAMIEGLEKQFLSPYENLNWTELRTSDPAEYAALKAEYQDAATRINQLKSGVNAELSKAAEASNAEYQQQYAEYLQAQDARAKEIFPELRDPLKAQGFKDDIRSYLKGPEYQYTDQEIDAGILDARQLVMINKARLYDAMSNKASVAKKKVAKLPKVVKPGIQKTAKDVKDGKAKSIREQLRKSGKQTDAGRLFTSMFTG